MSFVATANRMYVTDVDGRVAFDTLNQMFLITNKLNGSVSFPIRYTLGEVSNPNGTSYEQNNSFYLGACTPQASAVMGAFRLSYPGVADAAGVSSLAWYTLGGTYLHFVAAHRASYSPSWQVIGPAQQNVGGEFTHQVAYTFAARGGGVYLDEQVFMARLATANFYIGAFAALNAFTLEYRLLVGAFDA